MRICLYVYSFVLGNASNLLIVSTIKYQNIHKHTHAHTHTHTRYQNMKSYVPLPSTFKIFSTPFDFDCEEVLLQLQMELSVLQCSKDLKSKFLACHILDFYKNHINSSLG